MALRRPVGTVVLFAALLLLGGRAALRTRISALPRLNLPILVVEARLEGAGPSAVDRLLAGPMEATLRSIEGVVRSEARSEAGGARVRVAFSWGTDMELAAIAARERLQQLRLELPEGTDGPRIHTVEPSDRPFLVVAVRGPDPGETAAWVAGGLRRRLERLPGVAEVRVRGGTEGGLRVELGPVTLGSRELGPSDIRAAVQREAVPLPSGTVRHGHRGYPLRPERALASPAGLGGIRIPTDRDGGNPVPLSAVARITEGSRASERVRLDGRAALEMALHAEPDAGLLRITRRAERELSAAGAERPDQELVVLHRGATLVERTLTVAVATVCSGVVLIGSLLFGATDRRGLALAAATVIPVSLIGTVALFPTLGVDLHLLSGSGLLVGAGLLVDNAIVVSESIERRVAGGQAGRAAVAAGVREVAGPVTASTLTTLAVFVPLLGLDGLAGAVSRDFALAVSASLVVSWSGALTLVPVLAASALGRDRGRTGSGPMALLLQRLERRYVRTLRRALSRPAAIVGGTGAVVAVGAGVAAALPRAVLPEPGGGSVRIVAAGKGAEVRGRPGEILGPLEAALRRSPAVRSVLARRGGDSAVLVARLREPARRSWELLRPLLDTLPEAARLAPDGPTRAVRGREETGVRVEVGGGSQAARRRLARVLSGRLARSPEVGRVEVEPGGDVPALTLAVRLPDMARAGIAPDRLTDALAALTGGLRAGTVPGRERRVPYEITVATDEERAPGRFLDFRVDGVPIRRFAELRWTRTASAALRRDGRRVIDLRVLPGASAGRALLESVRQEVGRQPSVDGVSLLVEEEESEAGDARATLLRAAGVALALVVLVLVVHYESLRWPAVVLLPVPAALAGGAMALALTGQGWGPTSAAGVVLLAGVTVNDAIVEVDAIRRAARRFGRSRTALVVAGRRRFRPVVLTTATTVLGVAPLLLSFGPGAALARPLAATLVGGLVTGTLVALFTIPAAVHLATKPSAPRSRCRSPARGEA